VISRIGSAGTSRSTAAQHRADVVVAGLQRLAPHLDGQPDPDFRAATRSRLVAMAAVRWPEPEVPAFRRLLAVRDAGGAPARWRTRLTAGLAGAALTVTALATLVAVATDARPGEVLYGLKRGTEQTQLALAGDSTRGQTLLNFASTRLDELEHLVSEGSSALPAAGAPAPGGTQVVLAAGADPQLVIDTLRTMDAETTDGAAWLTERAVTTDSGSPLDDLAVWARAQSAGLSALTSDVPMGSRDALGDSLTLLATISTRAAALQSALECAGGPATDGADELGPVPEPCGAATPPAPPVTGGEPGAGSASSPGSGPTSSAGPAASSSTDRPADGPGTAPSAPGGKVPVTPRVPGGGRLPTPSLPTPSVAVPSIPLPLPTGQGGSPLPDLDVGVCLGPVSIGTC
jgi:hypothetical protein